MSSNSAARRAITLQASDLLCSNNCGFYGNPSWQGYCSVCYREIHLKQQQHSEAERSRAARGAEARTDATGPPDAAAKSVAGFAKFEQKRKKVAGKSSHTVSNLFRKSKEAESPPPARALSKLTAPTAERHSVGLEFTEFLRSLPKAAALDISRQVKAVVERIQESCAGLPVAEVADLVQDFYKAMFDRLNCHVVYRGINDVTRERVMDYLELYLMTRLYRSVFSLPEDEALDLRIQTRLRSLHWISADMLGAAIDEDAESAAQVRLFDAMTALIELNNCCSPQEKLACLVRSCKALMEALSAQTRTISADDFLPALILTVLRTNPPLLQSNLHYITRFAYSARLDTGETGYYFTTFSCAVNFLEHVDAEQLGMSVEEFESYVSGAARPPPVSRSDALGSSKNKDKQSKSSQNKMACFEEVLRAAERRQEKLLSRLEAVEHDWKSCHARTLEQAAELRLTYPLQLRPRETPQQLRARLLQSDPDVAAPAPAVGDFDAALDRGVESELPAPLLPQ